MNRSASTTLGRLARLALGVTLKGGARPDDDLLAASSEVLPLIRVAFADVAVLSEVRLAMDESNVALLAVLSELLLLLLLNSSAMMACPRGDVTTKEGGNVSGLRSAFVAAFDIELGGVFGVAFRL